MSIALALIGADCAVVAADGRVVRDDCGLNDDFDKTFSLLDGRIIGASTGHMGFGGQSVADRLSAPIGLEAPTLTQFAAMVGDRLRLQFEADPEITFANRRIDVLLAAREQLDQTSPFAVHVVNLRPDSTATRIDRCTSSHLTGCPIGEDQAVAATREVVNAEAVTALNRDDLIAVARRSIECGIQRAGRHGFCTQYFACGGTIRHRVVI